MGTQTEWDHGGRGGGDSSSGRGSHVNEADGGARADAQLVNARWAAPTSTVHRAPGAPAGERRPDSTDGCNICLRTQIKWRWSRQWDTELARDRPSTAGGKRERQTRLAGCAVLQSPRPQALGVVSSEERLGREGGESSWARWEPGPRVSRRPSKV